MSVTFADKLARMPRYQAGAPLEDAQAAADSGDAVSSPPTSRRSRPTRR